MASSPFLLLLFGVVLGGFLFSSSLSQILSPFPSNSSPINSTIPQSITLVDVLSSNSSFRSLLYALQRTNLIPLLNHLDNVTFFAPTNEAFARVGSISLAESISPESLLYHLTLSTQSMSNFSSGLILESNYIRGTALGPDHGQRLKILQGKSNEGWRVGKSNILSDPELSDRKAKNGIVHAVDGIFDPPPLLSELIAHLPMDQGGDNPLTSSSSSSSSSSTIPPSLTRLLSGHSRFSHVLDNMTHPHSLLLPAPKNLSFLFNDVEWAYLEHGKGRGDADILLAQHLLPTDIYLGSMGPGEARSIPSEGDSLHFHRPQQGKGDYLLVDGRPVESVDLLAANGVVHLLGSPLYPSSLLFTPEKLLYGLGSDKLAQILTNASHSSPDLVKWVTGQEDDSKGRSPRVLLSPADRWLDPDQPASLHQRSSLSSSDPPIQAKEDWSPTEDQLRYNLLSPPFNSSSSSLFFSSSSSLKKSPILLQGTEEDGSLLIPTLLSSSRTLGTPQPVKVIVKAGKVVQVHGALGPIGVVGDPITVRPQAGLNSLTAGLDHESKGKNTSGKDREEDTLIPVNGLLPPPPPFLSWHQDSNGRGKKYVEAAFSAGMEDLLGSTDGVTIFLPSDDTLTSSDDKDSSSPLLPGGLPDQSLLFDYLTLPMAKAKMSWVTRALVIPNRTLYTYDIPYRHPNGSGSLELLTESGETIWVSRGPKGESKEGGDHGLEVSLVDPTTLPLSSLMDGGEKEEETSPLLGRVKEGDIAVERGSVHIIDRLILPPTLPITPRDLLHGAGATIFLAALDHLGLQSLLESSWPVYTFLAPSDQVFEGIDLTELFKDKWKLRRLVLGHILLGVPHWGIGHEESSSSSHDEGMRTMAGRELESLLGKDKILEFSKDMARIGLKRGEEWARILRLARSHPLGAQSGEGAHMVLKVDRLLDEVWASLFWTWPLLLGLTLLILTLLGGSIYGGWKGYKIYQRRRGYDELRV
ncbi:MAG: hypothetical protein DHS80DRAFT_23280 [Piptocephalis tieghemiana]|nr:MAG: hypothetical protein DHS80DRAFT_23280 [Piptocephalis tieghemiana]